MRRGACVAICALALGPAAIQAQTVPLTGDAYFLPGSAGNTGAAAIVSVGGALGYQGLFAFDLSKLPPGVTAAEISSASLRLFVNKVGSAGTINLYAAAAPWSELTVNGLAGAPGPGALIAGPISVTTANSYLAIPVTALVQGWLNGQPNNGILVQAGSSATSVSFDSKESTATSRPAVIEIVLTPPAGPAGATGPAGVAGATGAVGPIGSGPQGATGATGTFGLAGAAGPVGSAGPPGPTGVPGTTGTFGFAGAAGAPGPPGPAGPPGVPGTAGAVGLAGAAGVGGPIGSPGPSGVAGATGATGPVGPAGVILNSFAISPVQPAGVISSTLTQNVILVNNTSAGAVNVTLPSAGPGTAGKDVWIDGNDFSTAGNVMNIVAAAGDEIVVHGVVVCAATPAGLQPCTAATFGPINYRAHVISDGNHRWYAVQWD